MVELKYNKWEEISIGLYNKIREITEDESLDQITKEAEVLSILCDVELDEIWNLPMNKIQELRSGLKFVSDFQFNKNKKIKNVVVGGIDCVVSDLNNFTYAQYVDFQSFYGDETKMSNLLTTILIPRGKKYNDGYDILEFTNNIENNLNVLTANEVCFFFMKKYLNSIKHMNQFLLAQIQMKMFLMKKTNPQYQTLKEMKERAIKTHHILSSLY